MSLQISKRKSSVVTKNKKKQKLCVPSTSISSRMEPVSKKLKSEKKITKPNSQTVYTHWLLKSEPDSRFQNGVDMKFSFNDLKNCPNQTDHWDGVRNYQARNFLRDDIKAGHEAFFYHSNCKEPGIVGICQVVKSGYVDHTQFDKNDPHYDSTSSPATPKWFMVDVKYSQPLNRFVPLHELKRLHQEHKQNGGPLHSMALFTQARLSVQPVSQEEWDFILKLSKQTV